MNLAKVKKLISKKLEKELDFEVEYKESKDELRAESTINHTDLDDVILLVVTVYQSGSLAIDLVLDKLDETPQAYKLMNQLNSDQAFLRAYSDEFLFLSHNVLRAQSEDYVIECIDYVLTHMSDDTVLNSLVPLSKLTHE